VGKSKHWHTLTALESWMQVQFAERKIEPNSTLGDAIRYMQNH